MWQHSSSALTYGFDVKMDIIELLSPHKKKKTLSLLERTRLLLVLVCFRQVVLSLQACSEIPWGEFLLKFLFLSPFSSINSLVNMLCIDNETGTWSV